MEALLNDEQRAFLDSKGWEVPHLESHIVLYSDDTGYDAILKILKLDPEDFPERITLLVVAHVEKIEG